MHLHIYTCNVSDGKLNVLHQVAYGQIGHTRAEDWTDEGLVI